MIKRINKNLFKITVIFLSWRLALIFFLIIATMFLPLAQTDRYLGGGPKNFPLSSELFSWANFDGEHYLSIAIFGYKRLEQAFFPIYPMLISFLARPFYHDLFTAILSSTIVGLLISNISFLFALIFLWELLKIDYSQKLSFLTLILIVIFPTSFYFASLYNESLFLLLSVLSFYSARKGKWSLAAIFGILSSATRVFGFLLLPALLIEAWQQKLLFRKMLWLFLIPLGLLLYMLYQFLTFGDPLAFYNLQKVVGEQHQGGIVILPQVYFRYIKMVATVDKTNVIYQTIILEFLVGIIFFLLPIYGYFKKIRLSYLIFAMLGFLLPTIQGSFSSVPRYVIVLFPSFLALTLWINSLPKFLRIATFIILFLLLCIEASLFLRGYWVA